MNRTDHEKRKQIIPWIDPAERMTMHFLDEKGLNAEVTGTTEELVDLAIETNVPHNQAADLGSSEAYGTFGGSQAL